MKPSPKVIVVNWNGLADTSECLESLQATTYPNYQTIVADNGSSGDDARLLRERFGDFIHLIASPENLGFAGDCNLAIQEALTDGILELSESPRLRGQIGERGRAFYQHQFSEEAVASRLEECIGRLARADGRCRCPDSSLL